MTPRGDAVLSVHVVERFWPKVDRGGATDCWLWQASTTHNGYGQFRVRPSTLRAHAVAWTLLVGPVPDGLVLDHLCRNRLCVNPAHMEPVTIGENVRRGMSPSAVAFRLGVCRNGHRRTPANTLLRPDGARQCRDCIHARYARLRATA